MNKKKRKIDYSTRLGLKKTWLYRALLINLIALFFLGSVLVFMSLENNPPLKNKISENSLPAFGLKNADPASSDIHLFPNDIKKFSIEAEEYETLRWYLDNNLVKENSKDYEFFASEGNHTLKVVAQNKNLIVSKSWEIIIENDEIIERPVVGAGEVFFYLILAIFIIIMGLIVWLFILEKSRPK